jgi:hypothetical protein
MMTSRSDLCDSVTGADYLLRFLRICLSLDIDSPLLKLSVQLLGNLSLVSSFREVLADEFNVADVLVSLLSNSTNASLSDALRKSLASVSQHPFMAMQLLQHDRLSRLRRKADGGDAAALWTIIVVANAVAFVDQSLLRALSDVLLQMVSEVTSVTAAEFARLLVLLADRSRDAILLANIKQRNLIDTLRKLGNPEAEFYLAALHLQVHKK